MANNLTPEQLAWLQQNVSQGLTSGSSGWNPNQVWSGGMDPNGDYLTPSYTGGWSGGEAGYGDAPSLTGYFRDQVAGHHNIGDMQDAYGTGGDYRYSAAIPKPDAIAEKYLPLALMTFGGAAGAGLLGGGGAATGGVGAAVDPMMYGGTGAADWGAGAAASGAGGAGAAAGGAGGAAGSGGYTMGSELFPAMDTTGMGTIPGLSSMTPVGTTAGGGVVASIAKALGMSPGAVTGLLGLAGAAAGSQGVQKTETATKDLPEWLKPYVQKTLGYGSGLLDQQMSPESQAQWQKVANSGMGLLSQPIAGNGFSKFFPGR